jgi:hypothetical protein
MRSNGCALSPLQIRLRMKAGETLPVESMKIPMIDLPLGATEDRVCGTIDIEKALTEGRWCVWVCMCVHVCVDMRVHTSSQTFPEGWREENGKRAVSQGWD